MASLESKIFYQLLKLIRKKKFLELQFTFGKFDFYSSRTPPKETSKICNVSKRLLNGRNVFVLSPKRGLSSTHILYLHGGAYVQNFVRQHWTFLAWLVNQAKCTITAPDYPLAPSHNYRDAFGMVSPIYRDLISGVGPDNLVVMGDSAGGGFALALAQKMNIDGLPPPRKIILLSPWLDITLSNPDIALVDPLDPFLGIPGLRKAGAAYAADGDLNNFMVSPVNGPLKGIGNICMFVGTLDILVADARKLTRLAQAQGVPIHYREYPDMVHMWMLLNFKESKHARKEIVGCINSMQHCAIPR